MLDPITRMSLSDDPAERARAARLVARNDLSESHAMVLRLLRDARSVDVTRAMAGALLGLRRESGIPLIMRGLGQDIPEDETARDHFDEGSRAMLETLRSSELDGVDVRHAVVSLLLHSDDRNELVGALEAIGWLATSGDFPASPLALAQVEVLAEHPDETLRGLARRALTALTS